MFRVCAGVCLGLLVLAAVPATGTDAPLAGRKWLGKGEVPQVVEASAVSAKAISSSRVVSFRFPGVEAMSVQTGPDVWTRLSLLGAGARQEPGRPELPVWRRLLTVDPQVAFSYKPVVTSQRAFDLTAEGLPPRIFPARRPIPKVPGALEAAAAGQLRQAIEPWGDWSAGFQPAMGQRESESRLQVGAPPTAASRIGADRVNEEVEVAWLHDLGIARGQRVLLLEVFPVALDAKQGSVILRESIEVAVVTENAQGSASSAVESPLTRPADTPPLNRRSRRESALTSRDRIMSGLTSAATSLTQGAQGVSARRLLIIAPPTLATSLGSFVAHKEALGWTVDSFTTEVSGSKAESIQAFIQLRYGSEATRPSHLLLVGDTDTIPAWPGRGAYLPDTDLYYACMDGASDWLPDMAVGRFPARTAQQLTNMLSRSMSYETNVSKLSPFVSRAVFVTSEENYTLTEGTQNYVIGRHLDPRAYASQRLYRHTYAATTSQVANAVNAGCSLLAYSGHAYAENWRDPALSVSDVQGLANPFACPLVMSFACDTGAYRSYDECFAEAWLRRGGNAGAVAVLAASEDTYWEEDDVFEKCVFAAVFEDGALMLGDAVEDAKGRYLAFYGPGSETLQYFEQYNLFGDPTLALVVLDGHSNGDSARAVRQLPMTGLNSNELFTVTVDVTVTNPPPTGLTLREKLPSGWTVTNATWKGAPMSPTNSSGEYRWVFGSKAPVSSGTLSYQTRAVGVLGATLTITGSLLYGTNTVPVLGDEELHILPIIDTDHDRMPDDWETRFGLSPTNALDAVLDLDGDQMSNVQEYLADTNPTNALSRLRLLGMSVSTSQAVVRWQGGMAATQYLERASSLASNVSWVCIYTNLPLTPLTNTFPDGLQGGSHFYRVRAVR